MQKDRSLAGWYAPPPMPASTLDAPSPAVTALLAEWGRSPADPRLGISPGDQMLAFLHDLYEGDAEQARCAYYRSGASIAALMLEVVRWRFGEARRARALLDFASGFGRVTRFLLDEVPPQAITVADVLPAAMTFQRQTFGVRAALSCVDPEQLDLPGPFDAILVTSLFSHLPERRFAAWLAALLDRLAPGGVLAFSTHDLLLLPAEQRPAAGPCFQPHSEITELATAEYGSMWVDEAFVRSMLAATDRPLSAVRFPRAVCNYQDLWVVVPEAAASFTGLMPPSDPEIAMETCKVSSREVALSGWAHAHGAAVAAVEVLVDGRRIGLATVDGPRPDVAAVRGEDAGTSGWTLIAPLPGAADVYGSVLLLRAIDARGGSRLGWVGRLSTAAFHARCMQLRWHETELHRLRVEMAAQQAWAAAEIAGLQTTVATMQASRFWKLRNRWFGLKRALRLTDES